MANRGEIRCARSVVFLLVFLIAGTGCDTLPRPADVGPLEAADRGFAPPSPPDRASATAPLLKKDGLSLEDVLAIADLTNPELASERKNIDLAAAAAWEARLYPNPSAVFNVEDYRTQDGATVGRAQRSAGLSLPLVIGGRIGAAASAAEKEREVAAVNYVWRRREILSEVKKAFLAYLGSRRNAELARENRDLAKTLHDVTQERFNAQAIPEMEVLKSAVQLAKAESDLRLAVKDVEVSLKALQARMGDADFPNNRFVGDLAPRFAPPGLETLRERIAASHPLLEAATKTKEAAELQLALARAERIPDVGLEATVGRDPEDDTIAELGIEIPIPIFNRNQAKIAAADARIRQAEFDVRAVRNDLLFRFDEAYRNFAAAQDRVTVYADEILPKARQALDQTNEGYRQGKFGYLDVLDAQRTLAEARVAHAAALTDLNLSAAEVEKLAGIRLETVR